MPTVHFLVKGRVQGVGYRFFAQDEADRLRLSGWVRNLPTGEVEVVASGPEENLRRLIDRLRKGPTLSRVTGVEVDWSEEEIHEEFHIR